MLINYIILLLLYWPFTNATSENNIIDQLATASENIAASLTKDTIEKSNINSLSSSIEANKDINHYGNTNGFIPMITTTQKYKLNNSTSTTVYKKKLDNDLYSSEARIFLNFPSSTVNRRSFESNNDGKEFEILKVNDQTPAVANYHEFYENLKSNRHKNPQSSIESVQKVPYHRTGERMKQIESYLNYDINQQQSNSNPYSLYYNNENIHDIQKKTAHEREKVHNNYQQHSASDYNIFGESVTRQKAKSLPSINYHNNDSGNINRNKLMLISKQRQSKPVVIVEPDDYNVNLHYGNQQSTSRSIAPTTYSYYSNTRENPEERYDKNEDYTEDNSDYYEVTERPRRLHKSRRKPNYSDTSKKLPKEHRGTSSSSSSSSSLSSANDLDELKKVNSQTRVKLHRTKPKQNYWTNENQSNVDNEGTDEDTDNTRPRESNKNTDKQQNNMENSNSWSQIAPNVEISQSNGYEFTQIDKPNLLVPINLNLVPLTNFDHSTALGNSQGFDFTNAAIPNYIPSGTLVSTASPLISSSQPILMTNMSPQSTIKNGQNINNENYGYSTAVPDVIVGQNSYQNAVQAVLLPQSVSNKYTPNLKTYYQSTSSPLFTINSDNTQLSKLNAPRVTAMPQLFYPSSTIQPLIHTPGNPSSNYNIIVNPHGLHGQNVQQTSQHSNDNDNDNNINNNGNVQSSSVTNKKLKKTNSAENNGQFLTSASFSVGHGTQSSNAQTSDNKNYISTKNINNNIFAGSQSNSQILKPQLDTNIYPKLKTYYPAQVIPAFVHTQSGIAGVNVLNQNQQQQPQQFVNVGSNIFGNTWSQLQQLQLGQNQQNGYNNRVQYQNLYTNRDNIGSTSNNNVNTINAIHNGVITRAQLPVVGVQTVEIQNPNIYVKPNSHDVSSVNQYSTAVLTTPIPLFSTGQSFLTPQQSVTSTTPESINIQSYVDSLTQIGAQNYPINQLEQKVTDQHHFADRPIYNPMNFSPSVEVVKSQTLLNGQKSEQTLPAQLSLVPVIPGGKFYKHSHTAQSDLITKPKLSSDLEKYAEEMFKESIRTIYNTHKWNSDNRFKNYTNSNGGIDFERLKSDLERYKAAMIGTKYGKDLLEAHHSEPQIQTTEPGRSKKPGQLSVADIEELFKNDFKANSLSDLYSSSSGRPDSTKMIKLHDFLTPPKLNSFISKSKYTDNNKPMKKRPGKTRSHSRPPKGSRPSNLETSASNHLTYSHRRPYHNRNINNDYRKSKKNHNYPTFTTSTPDINLSKTSKNDYYDINHPRMHNYLGLLMKTKQLPTGSSTSILRDDDDYKQFFDNDRRRMQINADKSLQSSFTFYAQ